MAAETSKNADLIYVIFGKDEFLVTRQLSALLDKLIEPEHRDMGLWQADAKTVTATEVFDELRTLSFLSEKKVVVIKDADGFVTDNRDRLEKYFDSPSSAGVLVMMVSKWAGNTRLAKKLSKAGKLITADEIKPRDLWSFASSYASEQWQKGMSRPVAQMLVDLVGDEPGRLCSEVDKLAVFVDKAKTITAKDIESLIGHNRVFGAFDVIDSMIAGNAASAISQLRNMFAADRSNEYIVVGAFAYHFRRLFSAKALMTKGASQQQVAKQLNIWNKRNEFFAQLNKMTLEQAGSYLMQLARIDYGIKTGGMTPAAAIESLVVKAAS
ncbi:MAG: DNA polymerase III subunit delta [Anaerohalosphaeraceae bacterium]|nr:DNA polymerase III subunit delta [Anaerohalosphaeraceae bacterium]